MIGMRRGLVSGLVAALLLLTVGVGNGHAARGATGVTAASSQAAVAEPTLLPVPLPDLSRMHASVQEQIREAYGALTVLGAGERSEAYGHLAKLLMASEYPDQAEVCLLNAQRLAPDDFRWPYYLGHVYRSKGQLTNAVERFEHTLRLRPDDVAAFVWLSHTYIDLGQPEAAEPVGLEFRIRSLNRGLGHHCVAPEF